MKAVFEMLWRHKVFIVLFTAAVTIAAALYAWSKNPPPVYKGSVLVEIGEIYGEQFGARALDNADDLAVIVEKKFPISAESPKGSRSLLTLSAMGREPERIKSVLQSGMDFILERHEGKLRGFQIFSMTKPVTEISVSDKPINTPKRKLIVEVAFAAALAVAIFLVFLKEFALSMRKENYEN